MVVFSTMPVSAYALTSDHITPSGEQTDPIGTHSGTYHLSGPSQVAGILSLHKGAWHKSLWEIL